MVETHEHPEYPCTSCDGTIFIVEKVQGLINAFTFIFYFNDFCTFLYEPEKGRLYMRPVSNGQP